MSNKIYVGNLSYQVVESELEQVFQKCGKIIEFKIIKDQETGRSKGFAFITFHSATEAQKAIDELNNQSFKGRNLQVNIAKERNSGHMRRAQPTTRQTDQQPSPRTSQSLSTSHTRFYNPYTFIPTPSRNGVTGSSFAGDLDPLPAGLVHDRLQDDLWTGALDVEAEIVTPLVLPTPSFEESGNGHKTFGSKACPEPSELRGMLRSAYETVTNSRLHGFGADQHVDRLGLRMAPQQALPLVPARVIRNGEGFALHLLPGQSGIGERGPDNQLMYAAWLPRYRKYFRHTSEDEIDIRKHEIEEATPFSDSSGNHPDNLPQHGQRVFFKPSAKRQHRNRFWYVLVEDIVPGVEGQAAPNGYQEGFVCITGPNIMNKHYERVFFAAEPLEPLPIAADIRSDYEALIRNYQAQHDQERSPNEPGWEERMQEYRGHEPGKTGFSRHVWNREDPRLKDGDLVYARVRQEQRGRYRLEALYPVMISRQIYPSAPRDLLPESLRHPESRSDLSPADRLFGWVARGKTQGRGDAAYRGRVKVELDRSQLLAVENFPDALPLAILGEPKPAQGRFYVAADPQSCQVQMVGGSKEERGYSSGKGLRGRKAFWHHKGLEQGTDAARRHWTPFADNGRLNNMPVNARFREYVRTGSGAQDLGDRRDGQNRSIRGWVAPGQTFRFRLHLHNATDEELGCLLWLLSLGREHHFRLGYGKPLGFGSLRLRLADGPQALARGKSWRTEYYADLLQNTPTTLLAEQERRTLATRFKQAMVEAYPKGPDQGNRNSARPSSSDINTSLGDQLQKLGNIARKQAQPKSAQMEQTAEQFEKLPFIAGFLQAGRGPNKDFPIHYPRKQDQPDAEVKSYEWFVANEKSSGRKLCLPLVTDPDGSLPLDPTNLLN